MGSRIVKHYGFLAYGRGERHRRRGTVRSVDLVYAAAIVALFVWLALGATSGFPDLGRAGPRTSAAHALAPVSAPGAATLTTPGSSSLPNSQSPPRVAASATIDSQQFEILVGEGPPAWSVAVSVDD